MWRHARDYAALTRRALRFRHDPLRRRSDRIEALAAAALLILLAVTIPVAIWLGSTTGHRQNALAEQQARDYRQVTATTVEDSGAADVTASEFVPVSIDSAAARWTVDGREHTGDLVVGADTPAGSAITIWVDAAGNPTAHPLSATAATTAGIMVGVFTWVSIALIGISVVASVRAVLDRRRRREWTAEIHAFLGSATSH